jgi:hemin uptake protein HemP
MPHRVDHAQPKTSTLDQPTALAGVRLPPLKSEALFDGAAEVLIDHRGVVYRLRQTSLGKLILTK